MIWTTLHSFLVPQQPKIKQSCHPLDHLRILYPFSKHSVCLNLMYELKWTLIYSGPKKISWTSSKVGSFMLKWNHFAFDYSWENNETNLSRRLRNEVLFKFWWSGTWFFNLETLFPVFIICWLELRDSDYLGSSKLFSRIPNVKSGHGFNSYASVCTFVIFLYKFRYHIASFFAIK